MRVYCMLVLGLLLAATPLAAGPIDWTLNGITLDSGRELSGMFVFDPDTTVFSTVAVTMSGFAGTFDQVAVTSTASLLQLFRSVDGPDFSGNITLVLSLGAPMTNAGGVIPLQLGGASFQGFCDNADCTTSTFGAAAIEGSVSGDAPEVPEPGTVGLMAVGLVALCALGRHYQNLSGEGRVVPTDGGRVPRSFLLFLSIASTAWGCSCGGTWPSVKQVWTSAPVVFLGTVESAEPESGAQQVRIRVDEAFKGVERGEIVELAHGGSSCDSQFRTGQRNVYYLGEDRKTRSLYVPWCTHSMGSPEPLGDDLLFLHGLPQSAIGTRFSGTVSLYEDTPTETFHNAGGIAGINVRIKGPGGVSHDTVTNAAGVYEMRGLPPGQYSVSVDLPADRKVEFPSTFGSSSVQDDAAAVILPRDGSAGVNFVIKTETRLAGRVFDGNGDLIKHACLQLEWVDSPGKETGFECTKEGKFEFEGVTPGKYWIVTRQDLKSGTLESQSRLYAPGVRDRRLATIVTVEAGRTLESVDMRLPADERRMAIAGRVMFDGGVTVGDALVTFTDPDSGYVERISASKDGYFTLLLVEGMQGEIYAYLPLIERSWDGCAFEGLVRKQGAFRILESRRVPMNSDNDRDGVILTLPSCVR